LYLDAAKLIWNGKAVEGKEAILKFLEDLPTSQTMLTSLDSQPVVGKAVTVIARNIFHQMLKNIRITLFLLKIQS
jgi:hypothetical protein